jgi:hypothetical protein
MLPSAVFFWGLEVDPLKTFEIICVCTLFPAHSGEQKLVLRLKGHAIADYFWFKSVYYLCDIFSDSRVL